jgi:Tfp pilus assembly protein PilZ
MKKFDRHRFEERHGFGGEVGVVSNLWDEEIVQTALDISPAGCFVLTELPLMLGDEVVVSFDVENHGEIVVFGKVVRAALPRRARDEGLAGFGIEFVDMTPVQRLVVREACRHLPPPVPTRRTLH